MHEFEEQLDLIEQLIKAETRVEELKSKVAELEQENKKLYQQIPVLPIRIDGRLDAANTIQSEILSIAINAKFIGDWYISVCDVINAIERYKCTIQGEQK